MKFEKLRISVVIPTFNRCHTLERALDSVFKQSFKPYEIIVVDNGSADGTVSMITKNYPSVKLLFEKKLGVSAARNLGIKLSKGNWIAFLDSDDEWNDKKLERQIICNSNNEKPLRLIHTNEIWKKNSVIKNQMEKHKKAGGNIFVACLSLCCISPSSSLIRKDVFRDVGYFDENIPACEDYDFWLRFCAREEVLFVDENLIVKHGGHSDQLSQKYWGMDRFRVYSLEKLLQTLEHSSENYRVTFNMLITKLNVLIDGGLKRKNTSLVSFYNRKKEFWLRSDKLCRNTSEIKVAKLREASSYYFE